MEKRTKNDKIKIRGIKLGGRGEGKRREVGVVVFPHLPQQGVNEWCQMFAEIKCRLWQFKKAAANSLTRFPSSGSSCCLLESEQAPCDPKDRFGEKQVM